MHPAIFVLLALIAAYGLALAALHFVRSSSRLAWLVWPGLAGLLCCPLLIPRDQVISRALVAFACVDLFFKLIDFARQMENYRRRCGLKEPPYPPRPLVPGVRSGQVSWADYLRFLVPLPLLLVVYGEKDCTPQHRAQWQRELARVLVAGAIFAATLSMLLACGNYAPLRNSFILNHLVLVLLFAIGLESVSQTMHGLERLAGYNTPPIVDFAIVSRTPAEFWYRYNTRVHRWLYFNVFRPSGGRHAPLRGLVVTFVVSALLHELMFGIATSRFDGYQASFFLLQIPGVLASHGLEKVAKKLGILGDILARGFTVLWFVITSALFFHGVDRVFPFIYAAGPWLP